MRRSKLSLHHPSHHAAVPVLRLERWLRRGLYAVLVLLAVSGLAWLAAHFFLRGAGEYGETIHPLEPWSMKLHGLAALAAFFLVGATLNAHIRRAIRSGRNLATGWSMIALLAVLALSGYGLYYVAGEADRPVWSALHWIVGLALPAVAVLHVMRGRRAMRT